MRPAHRDRLVRSQSLRRLMRWLFRWKGLRVVAHALRRSLLTDASITIHDFDGDLNFTCHLGEHMGSQIYWRGAYSWSQFKVLDKHLAPGMVFIDVGANQGEFTLFAAKRLGGGEVHAFEPDPRMYERLVHNVASNGFENITTNPFGLWFEEARLPLFGRDGVFEDGSWNEGLGSLFPTQDRSDFGIDVEVTTLDRYVKREGARRIDVLKLDVEGAEVSVLRGGWHTLERWRPLLLLEVDRRNLDAAGESVEGLQDFLSRWYRFEIVTSRGGTEPVAGPSLPETSNVLCLPL